jgi:RNA polymerase sigma factor (sigma-70 family)
VVRRTSSTTAVRDPLQRARALAGQHGGEWVDPWALGDRVLQESEERGVSLERASRDVVSEALHARAIHGEDGPRRRLLALWHGEVHRWCRGVAGRDIEPDDLVQEVLVRALARLDQVQRPARFGAWLHGTLLRVARERGRWARMRRFVPDTLLGEQPSRLPLADAALLASEREARVRLALGLVTAEQRVLLWAHSVEGQRRQDICQWSGLRAGTLNGKLTRARAAFERACTRLGVRP